MEEKKKDNKRVRLVIIIGIIIVLILILLGLFRCGKDETPSDKKNEVSSEKEYDVPENPSIGETVTGEEIEDEDGVTVAGPDENMDDYTETAVLPDDGDSSKKSNTSSDNKETNKQESNKTDSSNKNPGNTEDNNTDEDDKGQKEEEQPPKQPTVEEELGQSGDEGTEGSDKFGNLY